MKTGEQQPTTARWDVVGIVLGLLWFATFVALLLIVARLRPFWWLLVLASCGAAVLSTRSISSPTNRPTAAPRRSVAPMNHDESGMLESPKVPVPKSPSASTSDRTPRVPGPPPGATTGAPMADAPAERTRRRAGVLVPALSVPKAGTTHDENEDAFSTSPDGLRAVISDGASSAFRSGEWARLLCDSFISEAVPITEEAVGEWLLRCAETFHSESPADASWWTEDASGRGAFATFAALVLEPSPEGRVWRGVAVGDSVIVHLRPTPAGFVVVSGFPIESSRAFSGTPALVGSHLRQPSDLPTLRMARGYARPLDRWLLLTDETAKWAFELHEENTPIWDLLLSGQSGDIDAAIAKARQCGVIVNDDMTLVRLA